MVPEPLTADADRAQTSADEIHAERPVCSLTDVAVSFDSVDAVRDLSFSVHRGERVAIVGATGAGKSTVVNLLVGALAPTEGQVRVADLDPCRDRQEMRGKLAVAFQTPRLLPWRTALGNVMLGLQILGVDREERRARGEEWLARVHLRDALRKYPAQLSGGMRQRVSLARAFAVEPEIVLLDESFSALDEATAAILRRDFLAVCEGQGTTSLIVTHDILEAFDLAHRVLVFRKPASVVREYRTEGVDLRNLTAREELRREVRSLMTHA